MFEKRLNILRSFLLFLMLRLVYGFIRAATHENGQVPNPNFFDTLYKYAWFVTFGIAFAVYYLLMQSKQRDFAADKRG